MLPSTERTKSSTFSWTSPFTPTLLQLRFIADFLLFFLDFSKADIDSHTKENQITPLMFASRNYKALAVKHLLKRGADVNAVDNDNATAVIHACRVGALNVVKTLVEEGKADVTVIDKMGCSALDEADKMNMWECALLVWQHGCDAGTLKTGQGLGPVKWVRPRIAECPTARYHPGVCAYVFCWYFYHLLSSAALTMRPNAVLEARFSCMVELALLRV
jgi:hypothetical protein